MSCEIGTMTLRIESRIGVQAPTARIWSLIEDLPGWNQWNPVERDVSGTITFGGQLSLTERIEGLPERQFQARVAAWQPLAQLALTEKRGWQFKCIRYYEIDELDRGSCIVANGLILSGLRGESFYDRHRRNLRAAFEQISGSIKQTAESL